MQYISLNDLFAYKLANPSALSPHRAAAVQRLSDAMAAAPLMVSGSTGFATALLQAASEQWSGGRVGLGAATGAAQAVSATRMRANNQRTMRPPRAAPGADGVRAAEGNA